MLSILLSQNRKQQRGCDLQTDFHFMTSVYCHWKRVPSAACDKKAEAGFTEAWLWS